MAASTAATPTVPPIVDALVRVILRTPLLHRLMSRDTMLLSVTGRKSGRTYVFPVSYQRDGDLITCYTDHGWWRNLRGGAEVSMVVAGRPRRGVGEVIAQDHAATVETLRTFLLRTPRDARFHGVGRTANGDLDPADLDRAARTSVMVRIHLSPA